ncbi:conserved protein of unknown function [Bradyrhizobium sp. ORS 285]|uniref:hypothetical protein n=1 Tax=Bradyrhizobium sp. ORS 285 TaxID=115808 RepID=UPI000240739F|nr:hypothetical protein [Bradyrhizobium sp. ORS 285]CCD89016.1 conserved hypothetical protein [Bradyrhizobium sp. ORS 285]SMX58322.1 conserved protein of unknown function [Bradyrhizobium sp. ORS 285]
MVQVFAGPAVAWVTFFGVLMLIILGAGIYWLFNKRARLRDIEILREKLGQMTTMDPEYGAVRALYTSMVIDAHRWHFYHSDAASGDHGGSHHSGADDVGSGGHGDQ